jgi:hypothetical protein
MCARLGKTAALAVVLVLAATAICHSEVPLRINYQVMLTNELDEPLADQPVTLEFSIFDAPEEGTVLWGELHNETTNSIGVVSVVLGETTPLDFDFGRPLWLQIFVNGEALGPRRELTSSPYALHAVDSDMLGGAPAGYYTFAEDLFVPGSINDPSNPVDWSNLKNIPEGFADGTDDAGTGVSGSGTAGRVAKFTGTSTLGNSVIEENGGAVHIPWSGPGMGPILSLGGFGPCQVSEALLDINHDADDDYTYALINLDMAGDDENGSYLHCEHYDSGGGLVQTDFSVSNGGDVSTRGKLSVNTADRRLSAVDARGAYPDGGAEVIHAVYEGGELYDATAVYGESKPHDFYGYGGHFVGGYVGALGEVTPTGGQGYTGLEGRCVGGSGRNCGVFGWAWDGGTNYGVQAHASSPGTNYGVYASASGGATNYAGYFEGDVRVTGTLYNPLASLEIDHPEDPANSYLRHAFVASSEMKTVYDGIVALDGDGSAWVDLPGWFESLNGDFRYQLTAIGAPAPHLHIAEKISDGRFRIAGGEPWMEVSWQVTGVRHDAAASRHPLRLEEGKRPEDRGRYLVPEAFGAPASETIGHRPVERK